MRAATHPRGGFHIAPLTKQTKAHMSSFRSLLFFLLCCCCCFLEGGRKTITRKPHCTQKTVEGGGKRVGFFAVVSCNLHTFHFRKVMSVVRLCDCAVLCVACLLLALGRHGLACDACNEVVGGQLGHDGAALHCCTANVRQDHCRHTKNARQK